MINDINQRVEIATFAGGCFWCMVRPFDELPGIRSVVSGYTGGQFYDRGSSYRTAIFYHTDEQRRAAEASKKALKSSKRFKKPIVTEIVPAGAFYPAEEEHQRYYRKNPYEYKMYMEGSGRKSFSERHWMTKKDLASLRKRLTERQFEATQHRVFAKTAENEAWDTSLRGLFVDVVNGDPLFSTADRFESGNGWPSFRRKGD